MNTLQDIMGLISKRKIKTPTDKDYIISAAYADTQEVLKPQPKMEASLINVGALRKYISGENQGLGTLVRFSPVFQATGLVFTGTGVNYPTYNSYYVRFGQMVTFNIVIDLSTVTDFGTGQFKTELPFLPIPTAANHFSAWSWVNTALPPDELNGHIQMVADHLPNSLVLDLHWLKETTATPKPLIESLLIQGTPVTFTTASKMYINGTYICVP